MVWIKKEVLALSLPALSSCPFLSSSTVSMYWLLPFIFVLLIYIFASSKPPIARGTLKEFPLTTPGQRCRRTACPAACVQAWRTRCAVCWSESRTQAENTSAWPWGRTSTVSGELNGLLGRPMGRVVRKGKRRRRSSCKVKKNTPNLLKSARDGKRKQQRYIQ